MSAADPPRVGLRCPAVRCRADNDPEAAGCVRCGTPLRELFRLTEHPAHLFNLGLAAARDRRYAEAREFFAAVVHWCPLDLEARNALALACLVSGDGAAARRHFEAVLARAADDPLAARGLRTLAAASGRKGRAGKGRRPGPGRA